MGRSGRGLCARWAGWRPSRAAPRFGPAGCGPPLRRFAPCPRSSRAGAFAGLRPALSRARASAFLGLALPRPAGLGFLPPAEMSPTPGPSHPGGETANTRRLYLIRKKDSARCPTLAADSTKRPYILLNPPSAKKTALPFSASVRYHTPRPMRSGTVNKIAVIVESSGGGVACGPSSHENTSFADGVRRAEKEKKTLCLDDTPCSARCQVRVDDCRRFIRCSRSTSAMA